MRMVQFDTRAAHGSRSLARLALVQIAGAMLASAARAQALDWVQNPASGKWYAQTPGPTSWTAAEAFAQSFGAHLATVRSPAENAWLDANFFSALTLFRHHWIGLYQDRADPNYS